MSNELRILPLPARILRGKAFGELGGNRAPLLVERGFLVYRRMWPVIISGFFEPLFYLLSIGVGLGKLTGPIDGVRYTDFVAPALLAASAMNGAVYDSTINIF